MVEVPPSQRRTTTHVAWIAVQCALTVGLLIWIYSKLDFSQLARERLAPHWLFAALLCTAPAFAAAALRWSFTAQRLGVPMPFRAALREVYLASFLNSMLPTGIAGDLLRAARHAARAREAAPEHARAGRAWLAVVLERSAGQLLLWFVLLLSLAHSPALAPWGFARWSLVLAFGLAGALGMLAYARRPEQVESLTGADSERTFSAPSSKPAEWWRVTRRALFADGAFAVQLATSALVIASCTLGFACTAKGLSLPLSLAELLRVVPPVLALSALPVSIGGFGVREVASATLYAASGLDAATGALVATVYGLLNILGSAPGALFAWLHTGAPDER